MIAIVEQFRRKTLVLSVLLNCLFFPFSGDAQNSFESDANTMRIKQTPDFEVTGDGSALQWANAEWIALEPRDNPKVNYHANVKLLYSSQGIYCLYSCEDRKITATLQEDFSDLYNEDVVEIFFWPDEAVSIYFEYELSPTNYELAILVPNLKGNAMGWRPWHYEKNRMTHHKTKINSDEKGVTSWTAEFFIPFSLLKPLIKTAPQKGTRWRANMYRIDYDNGVSHFTWQPVRGRSFHDYERFGTIRFD